MNTEKPSAARHYVEYNRYTETFDVIDRETGAALFGAINRIDADTYCAQLNYVSTLASEVAAMKTNFRNCEVLLDNSGGGRYVRDRDGSFKGGNVIEFWFVDSRATMLHKKVAEPVSLAVFSSAMEAVGVKFNDSP